MLDIKLFIAKRNDFSRKFEGLADSAEYLDVWEMETKFCISKTTVMDACNKYSFIKI